MRILSDFHDYYDVGMALDQDQSLIYNRYQKTEEFENPFQRLPYNLHLNIDQYIIGFCGKIYKLLELNKEYSFIDIKEGRQTRKLAYNVDDISTYVRQHYPKEYNGYLGKEKSKWPEEQRTGFFKDYFNNFNHIGSDLFIKHRSPIFVIERVDYNKYTITYNAQLKKYEFYRIHDPYRAYQEISMWLSNQAIPIKPIPKIPDEIMVEIKGFDKKLSFRKDKKVKK